MGPLQYYLNGHPTIVLIQGAGPRLNLIFANQLKWAPYNNI